MALADDSCTTNQWVRLSEEGRLTGEVVLLDGANQMTSVARADIALVNSEGDVTTGRSNSKGRFSLRGVDPGIYSMATAKDGFFGIMAVHVLAEDQRSAESFPEMLTITATELDMATVQSAMTRYVNGVSSIRPSSDDLSDVDYSVVGKQVCSDDAYRVTQVGDGMKGKVYLPGVRKNKLSPAATTNVMVFRDGNEVARSVTDDSGNFEIAVLPPGNYGLMAAGTNGISVLGFELIAETPASDSTLLGLASGDGLTLVQQSSGPTDSFGVQLSSGPGALAAADRLMNPSDDPATTDESPAAAATPMAGLSVPPGSYVGGNGFNGGGTGGAGGGGLGGIAGLAGIGGIIAATAGDDDDNNVRSVVPAPASPSAPTP